MRDVTETPVGAFEPLDRLLEAAGSRWRAAQPEPRALNPVLFSSYRPPRFAIGWGGRAWSFLAGAASTVAILLALALAAPNLIPRFGSGAPATPDPATGYMPNGIINCPLTKPEPPFTPPPAPGADYDLSEGSSWYGTARLWTWLKTDGEIWSWLPESAAGRSQKTFWWRNGYRPSQEPRPEIYVTGNRLDGPGRFGFGPGTNASFGLGSAMLVGIEIPEAGCWEITARYGADELTIVVYVNDVGA